MLSNSTIRLCTLAGLLFALMLGAGCGRPTTPEGSRANASASTHGPDNVRLMPSVGHTRTVQAVAASRDGRLFVSGSADKSVRLWDVEAGGVVGVIDDLPAEVHSVALSDDGRRLVVGTGEAQVLLYELPSLRRIFSADLGISKVGRDRKRRPHQVWGVDVGPDGTVRSVATDGVLRSHDPISGAVTRSLPAATSAWWSSVAFSRDHQRVVVGSAEGTEMRSVVDGRVIAHYKLPQTVPDAIGISGDGKYVIVASYGTDHTIFDAMTGAPLARLGGASDCMMVATSPTEPLVAIGCAGGDLAVYELPSGRVVHEMQVWQGSCNAGAFTESGKRFIEFHDAALSIYSRDTWAILKGVKGAGYQTVNAKISSSGLGVVVADKSLFAVDLAKLRILGQTKFRLGISGASISGDGRVAIGGTSDRCSSSVSAGPAEGRRLALGS